MRLVLGQVTRFAVVGGLATLAHVATAVILVEGPGLQPLWANFLAFCAAVLVSYLGNPTMAGPSGPRGPTPSTFRASW
jgi:putative flippase GtrA